VRRFRQASWATALALVVILLLFGDRLLGGYVDWLWFGEVGQRGVFWRVLGAQLQLALTFGLALALLVCSNVALARRGGTPAAARRREHPLRAQVERLARVGVRLVVLGGSLALGLLGAMEASTHWEEYLQFRHPQRFGVVDPVFHHDVGFYVFSLPFWKYLCTWTLVALTLTVVATALVYYTDRALDFGRGYARVAVSARVHLSVLLGLLALAVAWGYRIEAYHLLFNAHGRYFGAGYADLHAKLPALNILAVVSLVAAVGFFLNAYFRALWLPLAALGLMVVASLTVGRFYPALVQKFQVQPNEARLESPYIAHNIQLTRAAFGLNPQTEPYPLSGSLSPAVRRREAATLDNIRLWDYRALEPTYRQLQGLRDYYDLSHIDVDRYRIGDRPRQVMLAARELVSDRLQNPSWVTETLQFTHGYGFVMNPVNEVAPNGQPRFLVSSLPLQSSVPPLVPRAPQIYFGEFTREPVIAPSAMPELDYSLEDGNHTSRFAGRAGLSLGSWTSRALFSLYLRDANLVLSSQITPASRLLIRRQIDERAARIAPFLGFDHDPYLVTTGDRLYWIQDAYTLSDHFPYSQPFPYAAAPLRRMTAAGLQPPESGAFNYIRNSVKVVVDAYSGQLEFYVFDPGDPIIRAYQAIFPGLFQPADRMPGPLRDHIRYPEDLFTVQARVLSRFHVADPLVFYNQTSFWDIPNETLEHGTRGVGARSPMEAYYVMMRLPGEDAAEYFLIQPFVFRGRPNLAAWLAARCGPERLGEMRLFTFDANAMGPELVIQKINSLPSISSELTLLGQQGSRVVWGNLLVLPMADTLLYVRPLYVSAVTADGRVATRDLRRVVVAQGEEVVMEPTLDAALDRLFRGGEAGPAAAPEPGDGGETAAGPAANRVRRKAVEADEALRAAQQALGRSDWVAYGQQMQRLQQAVVELRRLTGGR
jgi:uncharacterized membrane protein (UPF0182 family)